MARLVRVLRLVKRVQQLVLVIRGVVDAIITTFWVGMVVLVSVYVSAIFCTEYVGRGTEDLYPGYTVTDSIIDESEMMANFNPYLSFGDMPKSMLTLFNIAIMSEWVEVIRPVSIKQPHMTIFFILFVMFVVFGVMNVMVGMIVDNVNKEGTRQEEEENEMERKRKLQVLARLRKLIFHIDTNGDGIVSVDELSQVLRATPSGPLGEKAVELKELLTRVKIPDGLTPTELLCMLDNDGDGKLQYDEFVRSFYRLIESNDFQHMCTIQVGINHIKNLIKVAHEEADMRMENLEMSLQTLSEDLQSEEPSRKNTYNDQEPQEKEQEKEQKDGQDGIDSSRDDYLATLIKDAQKSIEQRISNLEHEMRDQRSTARCPESGRESQQDQVLDDPPTEPQSLVSQQVKRFQGYSSAIAYVPQQTQNLVEVVPGQNMSPPTASIGSMVDGTIGSIGSIGSMVVRSVGNRALEGMSGCLDGYSTLGEQAPRPQVLGLPRSYPELQNISAPRETQTSPSIQPSQQITSASAPSAAQSNVHLKRERQQDHRPHLHRMYSAPHASHVEKHHVFDVDFQESSTVLGFRLAPLDQNVTWRPEIISVESSSDALKLGIKVGDFVVGCNGTPSLGKSREEIMEMLRSLRPLRITLERKTSSTHVVPLKLFSTGVETGAEQNCHSTDLEAHSTHCASHMSLDEIEQEHEHQLHQRAVSAPSHSRPSVPPVSEPADRRDETSVSADSEEHPAKTALPHSRSILSLLPADLHSRSTPAGSADNDHTSGS